MSYKILAINPGSTSTKISVADGCELLFVEDVKHSRSELEHFHTIFDQYEYRKQHILQELERRNIALDFDATIGRGGLAKPVESGVYRVTPEMVEDQRTAAHQHPMRPRLQAGIRDCRNDSWLSELHSRPWCSRRNGSRGPHYRSS